MHTHSLFIHLQQRPEALERVLRVVRHRGFLVEHLNMQSCSGRKANIHLIVQSERDISLLLKQLSKLIDVFNCQILTEKPVALFK